MAASAAALIAAAAAPVPAAALSAKAETHCVVSVVDHEADGEMVMTEPVCFDTFAEALSFASGGAIALPSAAQGSDVFVEGSAAAVAAASFTIGIHYDGYGGSGSSVSVTGSSCTGGYWNTSSTWDNRISSSYNGCPVLRYYNYANKISYLGSTSGTGTTDNLPSAANNKAESISYSSS